MYQVKTLNKISPVGLAHLTESYILTDKTEDADAILVRSQDMHEMEFSEKLEAIARAGAGVNNIPLDRCAKAGIVVFNTPGANANAVKELVLCGMLLASRNVPAALTWAKGLTEDVSKTVEKGKSQFAGHEILGKTLGIVVFAVKHIALEIIFVIEEIKRNSLVHIPEYTAVLAAPGKRNIAVAEIFEPFAVFIAYRGIKRHYNAHIGFPAGGKRCGERTDNIAQPAGGSKRKRFAGDKKYFLHYRTNLSV